MPPNVISLSSMLSTKPRSSKLLILYIVCYAVIFTQVDTQFVLGVRTMEELPLTTKTGMAACVKKDIEESLLYHKSACCVHAHV